MLKINSMKLFSSKINEHLPLTYISSDHYVQTCDTTHHDAYVTGGQVLAKFKLARSKNAGGNDNMMGRHTKKLICELAGEVRRATSHKQWSFCQR